jgi:hypothetical protein
MDDKTVVTEKKSAKREKGTLIKSVREVMHPSLLAIPIKNPKYHYRWLRNTPDNLSLMEAKGYRVANSDEVRASGLNPGINGACQKGDLILGIEDYAHHREHREREAELKKRQQEQMKRGVKRPFRAGGFNFTETEKNG